MGDFIAVCSATPPYGKLWRSGDKHTKDGGRLYKCEKIPIRTTIYPLTCWKVEGTFASEKVLRNGESYFVAVKVLRTVKEAALR